jgi:hypothetical protein
MDRASYLMLDQIKDIKTTGPPLRWSSMPPIPGLDRRLQYLPDFLSADQVNTFTAIAQQVRGVIGPLTQDQTVGQLSRIEGSYKYIAHTPGRYDVWNIAVLQAAELPVVEAVPPYCQKQSVGFLFVDPHTHSHGKWHQDAVPLFGTGAGAGIEHEWANERLPPFYYTLLIALTDQTVDKAPTHFLGEDGHTVYWMPLKRGDAVLFDGTVWHRGSANTTSEARDVLYVIYAPAWYAEEKL